MIRYRLRSHRKNDKSDTAQKAGVIRIGCEKSEEQAQKTEEQICISLCGLSWSSPPKTEEQKQNQKILKKVLDKSAKPLYC